MDAVSEIKFRRDTSFRKAVFSPDSFAHPAKMDAQLLLWIVDRYTKPEDTILDPMAGSGTAMLGCTVGRNVVQVELEKKFVDMQEANWERVKMMPQLGHKMGGCQIIQGDARNLDGILADQIITSPPYTNRMDGGMRGSRAGMIPYTDESPDSWFTQRDQQNIGNLRYGDIDSIVTSPPYAEAQEGAGTAKRGYQGPKHGPTDLVGKRSYMPDVHGESEGQIGNFPYGSIDSVITSPPYEEAMGEKHHSPAHDRISKDKHWDTTYTERGAEGNIGNLKGDTYLSAMLQIYQQCHKVLKAGGLMVVVTKNFIRDRKEIRLDEDTIRLCEQAGFQFVERHYRKLPSQSFWRVIYQQKYPEAPILDKEDILVFQKVGGLA